MDDRAYFFRDVIDFNDLETKTIKAFNNNKVKQRFNVVEKILLTENEFKDFISSFRKTRYFIKQYSTKLTMNNEAEYSCLLMMCDKYNYGILINSSGYSYARLVAIINL